MDASIVALLALDFQCAGPKVLFRTKWHQRCLDGAVARTQHRQMARRPRTPIARPISITGFSRYSDTSDCMLFISRLLGQAGLTEYELPEHQRRLFSDLQEPLDEEALADMLAYWEYDFSALLQRGRSYGPTTIPAKPRIKVRVELTSKGNLKAEWLPLGWDRYGQRTGSESDFLWFRRSENRRVAYDSRPSNELFFLHGVQKAIYGIGSREPGPFALLNHIFLCACVGVVKLLKARLEPHFHTRMVTDIFVDWKPELEQFTARIWDEREDRILRFDIDDPAERLRLAELAELTDLQSTLGFSEQALTDTLGELEMRKRPSGPPPSAHTLSERLAKELKRRGMPATKGGVERALELIARHRKPASVAPTHAGSVVPFVRP